MARACHLEPPIFTIQLWTPSGALDLGELVKLANELNAGLSEDEVCQGLIDRQC